MPNLEDLSREELIALILPLYDQIAQLQAEIARLRGSSPPPPSGTRSVPPFVKPNRPSRPPKQRKGRSQAFARRREEPTEVVEHAAEFCPDCQRRLSGGWVHRVRQVIEIPVVRYRVIEHRYLRRYCGVCKRSCLGEGCAKGAGVGRMRVGPALMSLIVNLKHVSRMPVAAIQRLLRSLYGLHISAGEVVAVLHAVAQRGATAYEQLREHVRGSPHVHADETSWREDGVNHWLWSLSTPTVRLFIEDASRSHAVPQEVLGPDFRGVLCSDFLSAYSYYLGPHQRCWVHYLRDLKKLAEEYAENATVQSWIARVKQVFGSAKAFSHPDHRQRVRAREQFQASLSRLAEEVTVPTDPRRTLAVRIQRFLPELFVFVEHPDVPADNNPAERAIRPAVIYRKIAGGTRSAAGSRTFAVLASLNGTWLARQLDPFAECLAMLTQPQRQLRTHGS